MRAIRVEVTAEMIEACGDDRRAWALPVEIALADLVSLPVTAVDVSGGDGLCVATVGTRDDDWLVQLVGGGEIVTLVEATAALGLARDTLRGAARHARDGLASEESALAGRLGMRRLGRDWVVPRHRLDAEVARRQAAR